MVPNASIHIIFRNIWFLIFLMLEWHSRAREMEGFLPFLVNSASRQKYFLMAIFKKLEQTLINSSHANMANLNYVAKFRFANIINYKY